MPDFYMQAAATIYELLNELKDYDDEVRAHQSPQIQSLQNMVHQHGLPTFLIATALAMSQCVADVPPTRWVNDLEEKDRLLAEQDAKTTFTVFDDDSELM